MEINIILAQQCKLMFTDRLELTGASAIYSDIQSSKKYNLEYADIISAK
jgi:hypothetical protein